MRRANGRSAASGTGAVLLAVAIASLGAVGVALVSQHVFGMQPCPWCVLQRLLLVVIALVAIAGSAFRGSAGRDLAAGTAAALAVGGMAAALWQHFKAAASASCNLTFADKLISNLRLDTTWPDIFEPRASCADAAVELLGVSYDLWSLGLFAVIAAASIAVLRRGARGSHRSQPSLR